MIRPVTQALAAIHRARFDPRLVLVGFVLMFLASVGGFGLAQIIANKADEIATPVANICRSNSAASVELTSSGACFAADQARTAGPYVITEAGTPGERGRAGAPGGEGPPGTPGVPGGEGPPGTPGTPGTEGKPGTEGTAGEPGAEGKPGTAGEPGQSPPCLDEPTQCSGPEGPEGKPGAVGATGATGAEGPAGPPGPACPSGATLQPVTFASGEAGLGCVTGPAPAPDPEPAETTTPVSEAP